MPRIIEFLGYCPWQPARHRGDVLRQGREAAGLTQRQFAALGGVDPGTVSRWGSTAGPPVHSTPRTRPRERTQSRRAKHLPAVPPENFGDDQEDDRAPCDERRDQRQLRPTPEEDGAVRDGPIRFQPPPSDTEAQYRQ